MNRTTKTARGAAAPKKIEPDAVRVKRTAAEYLPTRFWLMKSEPDVFSFGDLLARPGQREPWDGVRNYQARNFMRDAMAPGHWILFYHSSTEPPGVAGIARVVEGAEADLTALDANSASFDPKATPEDPRWFRVTVGEPVALTRFVSLDELRAETRLSEMLLLRPGQRLSILPLSREEFETICALGGRNPAHLPIGE